MAARANASSAGVDPATIDSQLPVVLVGCGRMGGALARRLIAHRRVVAYDPRAQLPDGVGRLHALGDALTNPAMPVIVAVKPQGFASIEQELRAIVGDGRLFLSIMAGINFAQLQASLGARARVVRAMPNLPAAIGHGITGIVAADGIDPADRERTEQIFGSVGALAWLPTEAQLDVVTALAGSGPAYFFRFVEALAAAGVAEGLEAEVALRLARVTFTGAARLAESEGAMSLSELRDQVTSPGGTTAAGLEAMANLVNDLAGAIVHSATERSRALVTIAFSG